MKDYSLKINGQNYDVQIDDVNENSSIARVTVNGTPYEVEIAGAKSVAASKPQVAAASKEANYAKITPSGTAGTPRAAAPAAAAGAIKCPLPGTVLAVKVAVGDTVAVGQTLVVLEAMKMENNINADKDGKVTAVNVSKGESVLEGTDLVIIE